MWDPYIASIHENTTAEIVYDLFHVAQKITEAVDEVRKEEFAKADAVTRKKFKKKRFLILKRGKRLDEVARETLETLMTENERLYQAYLLKEQALDIFEEKDEKSALQRLERWFQNVKEAGFGPFEAVVKTIKSYGYGIANYFKYRLTNAASEAFNTKINIIKRRAYGFHDLEYFKLKILQACGRLS
jgi:transposase